MFALEPGAAGAAMRALALAMPKPRAIVMVSAHWDTEVATVGTGTTLATVHDFGGFDARLYQMQYPAQGSPAVAAQVLAALQQAALPAAPDAQRGLDHGAWIPLRQMYPDADIAVVPLSVQSHLGPAHAFAVGRALAPLARQGVCVVGSGNVTHNLRDVMRVHATGGAAPAYVQAFADWVHTQLTQGEVASLADYRSQPMGQMAHPTPEHFLPIYTALGAAGPQATARAFFRGISDHVLAMDGYTFA